MTTSMSIKRQQSLKKLCQFLICLLPVSHGWIQPIARRTTRISSRSLQRLRSSDSSDGQMKDMEGKTIYQRVFYMLDPIEPTISDSNKSVVVEERVRFQPDSDPVRQSQGYIQPVGFRTLILRDGNVQDGEIGKAFVSLNVHDGSDTHGGAGMDSTMDSAIAMLLYLASNPALLQGKVLEMSSGVGISSLLGCLGAGFVSKGGATDADAANRDTPDDDILSIPSGSPWLPEDLESLTLTDPDEMNLNMVMENAKSLWIESSKLYLDRLDWSVRDVKPFGVTAAASEPFRDNNGNNNKEYRNILAGDVAYTFPEAKLLARAVAYRLQPSYSFVGSSTPAPRFVHLYPDGSDENVYLRRFLERGYRMNVSQDYLKMEKIQFAFQMLPQDEPESSLDDVVLNVQERKAYEYSVLVAEHSVDYGGAGMGEYFFPIETGLFESEQGMMERDWESN
ncbi:hypothetical protein MPSEU_000010500 [Mayamaea pseudoterrestris]|nr:hypothetical protein MPSEU_000010500 [Mayamaea pseudoterrestris]